MLPIASYFICRARSFMCYSFVFATLNKIAFLSFSLNDNSGGGGGGGILAASSSALINYCPPICDRTIVAAASLIVGIV